MPVPFTKKISETGPRASQDVRTCSILIRPGKRSMWRFLERRKAATMLSAFRVAVIALFAVVVPATSSFGQAAGYVRVKFVKAGLMIGAGGGSGVLSFLGRDYPFTISVLSLGVTAGSSAIRLKRWASLIRASHAFALPYP